MRVDQGGQVYAIAHSHNYFWRLDFDIDGPQNDQVEEFEFTPIDNNYSYQVSVTQFLTETARTVNPTRMRSWRVRDTVTTNSEGHAISYHLDPLRVGHIHQGPAVEPFTNNQFYVTVNKPCERFASHNPEVQCAADVSKFVNGESLVGQDIVVWYGITFHHLPRDEDEGMMDAHWDGFQLTPRDWTATNPLDNVVLGRNRHADEYADRYACSTDAYADQYAGCHGNSHRHPSAADFTPAVALPATRTRPLPRRQARRRFRWTGQLDKSCLHAANWQIADLAEWHEFATSHAPAGLRRGLAVMSLYNRYRHTASAYWNINRLAVRGGARALVRRVRRVPRQPAGRCATPAWSSL